MFSCPPLKKKKYLILIWHLYLSGLFRKTKSVYLYTESFTSRSRLIWYGSWEVPRFAVSKLGTGKNQWCHFSSSLEAENRERGMGGTSLNAKAADPWRTFTAPLAGSLLLPLHPLNKFYIWVLGSEFFLCPNQEPGSSWATNTTNNNFLTWLTPLSQTFAKLTLPFILAAKFKMPFTIPCVITHQPPTWPLLSFCHHSHHHLFYSHCIWMTFQKHTSHSVTFLFKTSQQLIFFPWIKPKTIEELKRTGEFTQGCFSCKQLCKELLGDI